MTLPVHLEVRSANALSSAPINAPLPETLFRARAALCAKSIVPQACVRNQAKTDGRGLSATCGVYERQRLLLASCALTKLALSRDMPS